MVPVGTPVALVAEPGEAVAPAEPALPSLPPPHSPLHRHLLQPAKARRSR